MANDSGAVEANPAQRPEPSHAQSAVEPSTKALHPVERMSAIPATCLRRLQVELNALLREPDPLCVVGPTTNNMLLWYFILNGPPGTAYEGGRYIGKLKFPTDYPHRPPEVFMLTPNGRFVTDTSICLSIGHHHPEGWSPVWGARTVLIGLLSFMVEEAPTSGSMECSVEKRKQLALESRRYNVEHVQVFKKVLPDEYEKDVKYLEERKAEADETIRGSACDGGSMLCDGAGAASKRWSGLTAALLALLAMLAGLCYIKQ